MKTCNSCNTPKETSEFRVHKSGYTLGKCKECERKDGAARRKLLKGIVEITTKNGRTFTATLSPTEGSRKVTHPESSKVLYLADVSRDEARCAFSNYANVTMTGISTALV